MKSKGATFFGIIILIVVLLAAAGILWLGDANVAPPTQTINQTIPDANIPH